MKRRYAGFTLIELMIALAIFGLLLMLAGPQYANLMGNSQIRNAAEAMLNGVQQAQAAAIHGNTFARLVVDPTTGTGGWQVLQTIDGAEPSPPNPIQVYTLRDGAPKTTVNADATKITFDGFGRIVPNSARDPADTSATLTCIKVTNPNMLSTSMRQLNVAISSNGIGVGTKICDPDPNLKLAHPNDPQVCPAACS